MSHEEGGTVKAKGDDSQQYYEVRLPGFISDENVGLGDVVKRVTLAFGIRPCGGCEVRATMLNRWLVFTRRRIN